MQKSLGEIILLKNNELTFYSHKRCRKYVFTLNNGWLEYKQKQATLRLKYDSSNNMLYDVKPGPWFFIPTKIIWERISNDAAEKQIKKWQRIWIFLNKSEAIFRILFHSEILKIQAQKSVSEWRGEIKKSAAIFFIPLLILLKKSSLLLFCKTRWLKGFYNIFASV